MSNRLAELEIHQNELAADPVVPCIECGKDVGEHDVEVLGQGYICAACDDQIEMPDQTQADYWINEAGNGRWRTARKLHQCDARNIVKRGARCQNLIMTGDRYLDTGEANDNAISPHATLRYCTPCANITNAESHRLREENDNA